MRNLLVTATLLLATTGTAHAFSNTIAICTPDNLSASGEPIVVLASGTVAHLTWLDAHLKEPGGVRVYPVSDLKEVRVGYLSDLALQQATSDTAKLIPQKGRLTILSRNNDMTPSDTAYELLEMKVETVINYPDGRRLSLAATIPTGNHSVSWSFSEEGPGFTGVGWIDTHCEIRKSFVR